VSPCHPRLSLRAATVIASRHCHCERSEAIQNTKQSYVTGLLRRFAPRNDRIAALLLAMTDEPAELAMTELRLRAFA